PSAWTVKELGGTTCSSSGCGAASNTRRFTCGPMKPSARHATRSTDISTSTTAHQNTHLSMLLKRRDFADWDAIPWGILGSVALAGPAIAVARLEAVSVEEAGNQIVAGDQHQLTHGLDNIGGSAVALSAPALGQAQLAVSATHPVDDENDLGRRVVYIGHDLM